MIEVNRKKRFSNCKTILSTKSMHGKKKTTNELQQTLTPVYIGEKNLMLRQQQHHCFNVKQDAHHIKIVFNLKARKRFVFCFSDEETGTYFGVVIFWDVGRNCCLKNEKYIIFSKS